MKKEFGSGDTAWFTQSRFGMFIHWGLYAMGARHEWLKNREIIQDEDYQKYFEHFDPDLYDSAKWVKQAKAAGMKYVVLTTKHHEGFCLWDSKYTDYKAPNTAAGRDLLREFVDACRTEDIRVGFYYSLIDWHHEHFPIDRIHPRLLALAEKHNLFDVNHMGLKSLKENIAEDHPFHAEVADVNAERDVTKYAEYMRNQVTELLTDFGKIDIIWFDFSYPQQRYGKCRKDWESEKLVKLIRSLQPDIMINNRLNLEGAGDFATPEQIQLNDCPKDADGNNMVWEGCQTFSGSWGYNRDETSWKSPKMLIDMLINHVSRGGNLLMNVGPDARGEFDARATKALDVYGKWMHLHGRSIYACTAAPDAFSEPEGCRYTYNAAKNRLYVHMLNWPYRALNLPGLADRVKYAQLLNDGSELKFTVAADVKFHGGGVPVDPGTLQISLPIIKPDVEVPVIELFLK